MRRLDAGGRIHSVAGKELTCAVMGDRALDVIEITAGGRGVLRLRREICPKAAQSTSCRQPLKPNIYQQVQQLALTAHQALGCRGVSRADFRYDDLPGGTGERLICLEVNTQPGMTQTSLVPELAAHAGLIVW
jgi:D-alanine-D-alanine ligase